MLRRNRPRRIRGRAAMMGLVMFSALAAVIAPASPALADPPGGGLPGTVFIGRSWYPQENGNYCAPASVQMALQSRLGYTPHSQSTYAWYMGTDDDGTDDAGRVARELNRSGNTGWYEYKTINWDPTQAQRNLFKYDVMYDIDRGYPMVVNLWIPAGYNGAPPNYPNQNRTILHYVTVVGYANNGDTVYVYDPAAEGAGGAGWGNVPRQWTMSTYDLETLIGGKGYAA
ncbi:C39 family peptidase [Streptomyces sp. NBC_00454]|uniref:C39 family peptidase n=1 Tax=Streptomyces sp. NBC_00454 TaxID=2975747 RepID=UPI0030E2910C